MSRQIASTPQIASVAPNCFCHVKLFMSRQIASAPQIVYVPSNCFYTPNCLCPVKLFLHPKLLRSRQIVSVTSNCLCPVKLLLHPKLLLSRQIASAPQIAFWLKIASCIQIALASPNCFCPYKYFFLSIWRNLSGEQKNVSNIAHLTHFICQPMAGRHDTTLYTAHLTRFRPFSRQVVHSSYHLTMISH